jgi:hypothetical protein
MTSMALASCGSSSAPRTHRSDSEPTTVTSAVRPSNPSGTSSIHHDAALRAAVIKALGVITDEDDANGDFTKPCPLGDIDALLQSAGIKTLLGDGPHGAVATESGHKLFYCAADTGDIDDDPSSVSVSFAAGLGSRQTVITTVMFPGSSPSSSASAEPVPPSKTASLDGGTLVTFPDAGDASCKAAWFPSSDDVYLSVLETWRADRHGKQTDCASALTAVLPTARANLQAWGGR